jgi:carotenoid cleavage dioxygenase-like enzyme
MPETHNVDRVPDRSVAESFHVQRGWKGYLQRTDLCKSLRLFTDPLGTAVAMIPPRAPTSMEASMSLRPIARERVSSESNQFLSGNFAPVSSETTAERPRVHGRIPRDLDGRLLRIGPNPAGPVDSESYHWFTGTGMVHSIRIREGRADWYRSDDRVAGKRHRYCYSAHWGNCMRFGPAFKHDLVSGQTEVHHFGPGRVALKPVFVPRAIDAAEDDGYVMAYVYDAGRDRSDAVIWSATEFTAAPLAVIELPVRVPFGFHGDWIAADRP